MMKESMLQVGRGEGRGERISSQILLPEPDPTTPRLLLCTLYLAPAPEPSKQGDQEGSLLLLVQTVVQGDRA